MVGDSQYYFDLVAMGRFSAGVQYSVETQGVCVFLTPRGTDRFPSYYYKSKLALCV